MTNKIKILVSVYNISGYLIAEVSALLTKGAEISIVEVPCRLSEDAHKAFPTIRWIDRSAVVDDEGLSKVIEGWLPDIFLCCGWNDKMSCNLARRLHALGTTTVVGVDNPWEGTSRQFLRCLISRFYLLHLFDFGWGSGEPQAKYLKKLGFFPSRIKTGFYCADTNKFSLLMRPLNEPWPHSFIYVGRYVADKNMRRMERGFLKALKLMPDSDWNLRCIGGGVLWEARTLHPRIEHLGYKAPSELQNYIGSSGCFVLPSTSEHWGVVVHEFALMGLPLICSNKVMATTAFVKEGENGFLFDPYDVDAIAKAFCRIMQKTDDELALMGSKSHDLGMRYTTDDWAERLLAMRLER